MLSVSALSAQDKTDIKYWNQNTQLLPWRIPLPAKAGSYRQDDLDKDGDPDLIYSVINDSIPVIWIDDDDDMKWIGWLWMVESHQS